MKNLSNMSKTIGLTSLICALIGCGGGAPIEDGECFAQWPATSHKESYQVQIAYNGMLAGSFYTYKTGIFVDCPEATKTCYRVTQGQEIIVSNFCF